MSIDSPVWIKNTVLFLSHAIFSDSSKPSDSERDAADMFRTVEMIFPETLTVTDRKS